jgi:hypothetical protein
MSYVYTFLTGILIGVLGGVLGGVLVYRNNAAKLKAGEEKGKSILDALKGR